MSVSFSIIGVVFTVLDRCIQGTAARGAADPCRGLSALVLAHAPPFAGRSGTSSTRSPAARLAIHGQHRSSPSARLFGHRIGCPILNTRARHLFASLGSVGAYRGIISPSAAAPLSPHQPS